MALGATGVACGSAGDGAAPAPSPTSAVDACTPARGGGVVDGPRTFRYDDVERSYLLAVPPDDDGRTPLPLVVDFHGHGGSKEDQEANTSMGAAGTARGFVVVTPDGLGNPRRWNWSGAPDQPDDFGFVHALVDDLESRLCIDPDRVYAAGHSNGSAFAAFLVCHAPHDFAAVAMVSGTTPTTCPDGVRPAALAIHGTADARVPYAGGGDQGLPGAVAVMAGYAERYGCATPPKQDEPIDGVERSRYPDCPDGTEVVLDTVVGGVHTWPGGPQVERHPEASAADRAFDATGEILDFFARHGRGSR